MSGRDGGPGEEPEGTADGDAAETTLMLGGDVMIGRGIDQAFGTSVDPRLHEPHVRSARRYLALAEQESGPIPEPLGPAYVWGDALELLNRDVRALRIVNLETAITAEGRPWEGKGIHYRVHPENVAVLEAAGIDCCVLANNHALDWGRRALVETVERLRDAGIAVAGAGRDADEAAEPALLEGPDGTRVAVHAFGSTTSGIPPEWQAATGRPGVHLVDERPPVAAGRVARQVERHRERADTHVVSIHWGGNWGYGIPEAQRRTARVLVEEHGVSVLHGHSSHHPKAVEVRRGRPILYGCGDLLNDYEGIGGRERFRGELVLLYEVRLGELRSDGVPSADVPPGSDASEADVRSVLRLWPFRLRRFRLERPSDDDVAWLRRTLDREGQELGTRVVAGARGSLEVLTPPAGASGR